MSAHFEDNHTVEERRGREPYVSSGRGGAGNIHPEAESQAGRGESTSRGRPRPADGPDDFSHVSGRELEGRHVVTHSGRGGAGNVRSPSRDPTSDRTAADADHERVVRALREEERAGRPASTGRGGSGNIARSRSRDAQTLVTLGSTTHAAPHPSSTFGRGGVGNTHLSPQPEYNGAGYDLATEKAGGRGDAPNTHRPPLPGYAGSGYDLVAESRQSREYTEKS